MSGTDLKLEKTLMEIGEVRTGMVLAENIIEKDGTILLTKNTVINKANYSKLLEKNIKKIYIKKATISVRKEISKKEEKKKKEVVSVAEREEFIEFEETYDKKLEESKDILKAIGDGETVDIDELYMITDDILESLKYKTDILTFIGFLKSYDEYTFSHSINVSLLCNLFAYWLQLDEEETIYLTTAGMLHDIGKMKISKKILNKRGRLTDSEFEIMKQHSVLGYRILKDQDIPNEIKLGTLMHHERIDGSGYPLGVRGDKISKYAKIISICDIYDAMTSDRIYRGRICPFEVIKTFEVSSYGELDTTYLLVFLKNIAYTYFGSWVRLDDGRQGEVVFINPNSLSRPMIRVGDDIIDLSQNESLEIIGVI